jgi:hypothetical protein
MAARTATRRCRCGPLRRLRFRRIAAAARSDLRRGGQAPPCASRASARSGGPIGFTQDHALRFRHATAVLELAGCVRLGRRSSARELGEAAIGAGRAGLLAGA